MIDPLTVGVFAGAVLVGVPLCAVVVRRAFPPKSVRAQAVAIVDGMPRAIEDIRGTLHKHDQRLKVVEAQMDELRDKESDRP